MQQMCHAAMLVYVVTAIMFVVCTQAPQVQRYTHMVTFCKGSSMECTWSSRRHSALHSDKCPGEIDFFRGEPVVTEHNTAVADCDVQFHPLYIAD